MQQHESQSTAHLKSATLDMDKWQRIVNEWDASKENQKDYCHRLGVSLNTFSYVRGKLADRKKSSTKFIPITLTQPAVEQSTPANLITLENPSGFKIHFSPSLSIDQLSKIFKLSGWKND